MNTKTEVWNGYEIRFVEKEPGDWWAVARDVAEALEYAKPQNAITLHCNKALKQGLKTGRRGNPNVSIIPEPDIYRLIFRSKQPDAESFQDWVCDVLKHLRQASGLEGFQVFRMLDKEHQEEAMRQLCDGLHKPVRRDFIKANTIANKAVSSLYGHPKMLKKDEMSPDMLARRQSILDDTVNLMTANESFDLGLSVSDVVYGKYC